MKKSLLALPLLLLSTQSFAAKETLRVLVVFDKNTINTVSSLNSYTEKYNRTKQIIIDLKKSYNNSGLGNDYDFQRIGFTTKDFTTAYSGTPTIFNMASLYEAYMQMSISDNKKPYGVLQNLQKQYKADIVFGVFPEKLGWFNTGTCGAVTAIPGNNLPNGISSVRENLEVAGYGISFLNATTYCMNKDHLAAHESGHGNGLYHGAIIDGSDYNIYKNYMIDNAMGFGYKNNYNSNFSRGTVMAQPIGSSANNRFSDDSSYKCGYWKSSACGDAKSNAVSVLKQYKSNYNKRGNWYN